MELLNLEQGSQEWLDFRLNEKMASEAPIMMGASKFMTRKQLLDHKKGWITTINEFTMKIFNEGHKAEEQARNVLSIETMDDYLPCVGVSNVIPDTTVSFAASFDGRSDDGNHLFEHKMWNETLAENVRNKVLEPAYYWQLEHQLLVDQDSDYVLFVVSDGTAEKREMMKYFSVPERREELINAWLLFEKDLENHVIEAKQEAVIADKKELPAIHCKVEGTNIISNLPDYLTQIKDLAIVEMKRDLQSDSDFAEKDQLNKAVKKTREELKQRVADIKTSFVSYAEFEGLAADIDSVLQKMYAHGEKQVKQAKEAKKEALKKSAHQKIDDCVFECNREIGAEFSINRIVNINPEFDLAMKNKRTIASLEDALDTVVNEWKITLTEATKLIAPNFELLEKRASDYKFLFNDVFELLNQPFEAFKAIVTTRINDHKKAEEQKQLAETARIQAEATAIAEAAAAKKLADDKALIEKQARDKLLLEQEEARQLEEQNKPVKKAVEPDYPVKGTEPDFKGVNSQPVKFEVPNGISEKISEVDASKNKVKQSMNIKFSEYIDSLDHSFLVELAKIL
ncbi:MAG: YqaJ viral recombinase family protein [Marinifilaceae bacterium]